MKRSGMRRFGATALALAAAACSDLSQPIEPESLASAAARASSGPVPSGTISFTHGDATLRFWPYTSDRFSGTPAAAIDPVNLIFTGFADPRSIRAALLGLGGDRTGYLPAQLTSLPFYQCTWDDAMGGNQTAWAEPQGWSGSAIQLECGSYIGLRFHLRLFAVGGWTIGNAHFETDIPGLADHQVLSWDLAKYLVAADLVRAGIASPAFVPLFGAYPEPSYREIHPALYYNPAMQPLHPLIQAVVNPEDPTDVRIRSDGMTLVLTLLQDVQPVAERREQTLTIQFGQMIPRPFCAQPGEYVYVSGPVELRQHVVTSAAGNLMRQFKAAGQLMVVPIDPLTQQPIGMPMAGTIEDHYTGSVNNTVHSTSTLQRRSLQNGDEGQEQIVDMKVGPHGVTRFSVTERC
jgi:hypothetical protein